MLITETPRLQIRPLSPDDAPALDAILGDPAVMEHSVGGVRDEAATRRFIDWCRRCYDSHGVGPWALIDKQTSDFVGFCGVGPERVHEVEEINLGYRLAHRYWGKGLATEAARASLDYAFGTREFLSIVAIINPDHGASLRVAEKSGFVDYHMTRFHGHEVRLYRLLREQWATD